MKNNKGFTVVELAVSFCLVAAISLMLLQLVLSLKEIYLSGDIKTTLLNKQGIMTKKIYDDLNNKDLKSINSCGLSCLLFTYSDGKTSELLVDPGNKTITYGDYTLQLDNSSSFGKLEFMIDETSNALSSKDDSIFKITIPIISKLIENEDFGISIVKTYNRGNTIINKKTNLTNTTVTLSGVDTNLDILSNYDEAGNFIGLDEVFIKIYHQEANNYVNSFENFIKNKNANTLSTLTSLPVFKTKYNKENIINAEKANINSDPTLSDKQKQKNIATLEEAYQNGYYSFILSYNDENITDRNYFRWYQTSNFASKESLKGFSVSFDEGVSPNGLIYNNEGTSYSNILGSDFNLGIKSGDIIGIDGISTSVDLYVGAREYICKYSLSEVMYNGKSLKSINYSDGTSFCLES